MAGISLLPDGTAAGNSAAQNQSLFSSFFISTPSVLVGMDDASRMGNVTNDASAGPDILGYGRSTGIDVGVGNNGEIYIRGTSGAVGTSDATAQAGTAASSSSGVTLTPGLLLLLAVGAFLLLK